MGGSRPWESYLEEASKVATFFFGRCDRLGSVDGLATSRSKLEAAGLAATEPNPPSLVDMATIL
uniref:Uncharacterized protein n=1 Tax=Rhizophora mucronata TaxID=61149 RepID=A0A2P2ISK2_RHIMU